MKRITIGFVTLALLFASWPVVAGASPPTDDPGWWAEYYANPGLFDGPTLTRVERDIDYNWGRGAPAPRLPADHFSVRWTRSLPFEAAAYTFCVTVDDGVRLWVDGHLIIDQWKVQPATTYCAEERLSAGPHVVQMAYFENTGEAVAKLWWTSAGGPPPGQPGQPGPPGPPGPPASGWNGQYFDNIGLSGQPALTRVDPDLRFDWGMGAPAPGLPADNFSVRWIRDVFLPAGTYSFFATHDDGVRLWVDRTLVIDFWHDQAALTHSGTIALNAGTHQVVVEYYEHTGFASIGVWWGEGGNEPPGPGPSPGPGPGPGPGPNPGPVRDIVIDNTDPGFMWGGPLRSRFTAQLGIGGNLYWTHNSTIDPVNYGKWVPRLPVAGTYEVFVFVPARYATSENVRYRILHNGERNDRIVDQGRYHDQWVSLGTYYFNAAGAEKEFVLVYDNTREPFGSHEIAFDAMKFVLRR
jgi:hypothetical protein